MKKAKVVRVIIVILLLLAVILSAIFLYFKFYGKNILENALSGMLGIKVKFEGVSLNLDDYTINFKGVSLPEKIDFGNKAMFSAEKFIVILDKEKFDKDREVTFDQIVIEKGKLHIERNKAGVLNVSYNDKGKPRYENGAAYADAPEPKPIAFYNFAKGIKKLTIKESVVEFKDDYIYEVPFTITANNFNLSITSERKLGPSGSIPVECVASFRIPSERYNRNGEFFLRANMAVYKYMMDAEMRVETRSIDIMRFFPYFEKHTPFSFQEGLFSSKTDLRMHSNRIASLTTMEFHRLKLAIDPGAQNAEFLNTTANKLIPYLTSSSGSVIFDFVINGPVDNPRASIGPKVKEAMGMVAMEELTRTLQGLQGLN